MASLKPAFRPDGNGVIPLRIPVRSQMAPPPYWLRTGTLRGRRFQTESALPRPRRGGSDPMMQLTGVIPATALALKKREYAIKDIDWFEINEAFAAVVLSWAREIHPNMDKVNPWGGAIAHGHPLGATGAGSCQVAGRPGSHRRHRSAFKSCASVTPSHRDHHRTSLNTARMAKAIRIWDTAVRAGDRRGRRVADPIAYPVVAAHAGRRRVPVNGDRRETTAAYIVSLSNESFAWVAPSLSF